MTDFFKLPWPPLEEASPGRSASARWAESAGPARDEDALGGLDNWPMYSWNDRGCVVDDARIHVVRDCSNRNTPFYSQLGVLIKASLIQNRPSTTLGEALGERVSQGRQEEGGFQNHGAST